jgi:transcription initiation factor TFIID subunit 1
MDNYESTAGEASGRALETVFRSKLDDNLKEKVKKMVLILILCPMLLPVPPPARSASTSFHAEILSGRPSVNRVGVKGRVRVWTRPRAQASSPLAVCSLTSVAVAVAVRPSLTMATPPSLDFEALLSRDYSPADVTRLIPREKFHPAEERNNKRKQRTATHEHTNGSRGSDGAAALQRRRRRQQQTEETNRLVLSLVAQTPAYKRHVPPEEREDPSHLLTAEPPPAKNHNASGAAEDAMMIDPQFHEVALGNWESKIMWDPPPPPPPAAAADRKDAPTVQQNKSNALALLEKPRNPFLDDLELDISDDPAVLAEKARNAPLILELGVAGRSVARQVYQNLELSAQRPVPASESDAYRRRVERDWAQPITSTADVPSARGTLHADKDRMEALIEERQKKRAQMAVEKTTRVTEAMGTMALGGGRGRTITSSLMGPGGTERTGRPSRAATKAGIDVEYIEQLDMVNNHNMVRDLSKILLREYMRPKLPLSVVRADLSWQFQIRYVPSGKKSGSGGGVAGGVGGQSSSYQAIMMGTHAGAISRERLRTEPDLSPSEGKLVLLEYVEERPPIQLTKGMCSKIVNYYRGDKSRCPVSAGGGDRPARRKRAGDGGATVEGMGMSAASKNDRLTRLAGPNQKTTVLDWIGKLPKKSKEQRSDERKIDILPEGVTEILHPKVHGPFLGEIEEGSTQTGLVSNLFVAPMFAHEPESTDFLMILTPPGGATRAGQRDTMGVILRDLPSSVFTVGQTEPRARVNAPGSQGEKNFVGAFVSYNIARTLFRTEERELPGLRFDELHDRVLPNLELASKNHLRQRLKQVALYDKNTQIWTIKPIGYEDFPGFEALGKSIEPESVATFETACAAKRRLEDLGLNQLAAKGSQTAVASIGVTMVYLAGQLNAARELFRKTKRLLDSGKSNRSVQAMQIEFYEKAAEQLESYYKSLRQKHEVAQFIYEELQLAPWHLTGEFLDVHKKGEGTGMMKLTGLGDPSGTGEGFSFLREVDSKPSKSVGGGGALNAQLKKITGTENDLRKLTMKQMAALLRSYGMGQKYIDTLQRWDRVHVIRDLSTKAASDGLADGLERFARGEKMKLSEQKQIYNERIQVIWKRQIAALSVQGDRGIGASGTDGGMSDTEAESGPGEAKSKGAAETDKTSDDSGSDSDDDLAAALEDEMLDRSEANQLVAAYAGGSEIGDRRGQLFAAAKDQDLTKDARELAALKRQREEERAAKEGLDSMRPEGDGVAADVLAADRKVIRKRITLTSPDGRQKTSFKFIVQPKEVGRIMERLQQKKGDDRPGFRETKYEHALDEKPPGHSMFEDEDDFEISSEGRFHAGRRRGRGRRGPLGGRATPRARNLQIGKLKTKISKEDRMRKRKREEEEREVYSASAKRKGNSNRRERGSIRDRQPHVMFAKKLEEIRSQAESRPMAGPFLKPVNKRIVPKYYELISHPIDLQTIRDRISKYEYRTADAMIRDFELMKSNAIKFNGEASPIAKEAIGMYDLVKSQVEASREELSPLEEATESLMSGQQFKKKKKGKNPSKKSSGSGTSTMASVGRVDVDLGNLSQTMNFADSSSGSDDSIDFSGLC